MTYGSETMPLLVDVGLKFGRAEMQMIRWMCGISLKDRSGRLRWYGHLMRKGDEDWVKKCMELKAEDRLEDQERHG